MGIGNKLVFDVNNNVEDFVLILATKDYTRLGAIRNVIPETVQYKGNLNSTNEIKFEVYKIIEKDGKEIEEPLWNEISNFKTLYVMELNEYFEINVELNDSNDLIFKTVTATSLCEAELSQKNIYSLEVNTETDIDRDDYTPTVFYNPSNPTASLLHRVLTFAPHYTIKHVDSSLMNIQRTFSVDNTAIYDWLIGECADEFKCLFVFDSTDRSISVYDLYVVCQDCGHRADIYDFVNNNSTDNNLICPKCSSKNVSYFGEDTTIYIDRENLTDEIQFSANHEEIKNSFRLSTGDDIMTSTVKMLNAGGDYIINISSEQKKDMPKILSEKIDAYEELYESKASEVESTVNELYETMGIIDELKYTMMPSSENIEVTAQTEADKLTAQNLSPLGLSTVTSSTSKSTVESFLLNYARVYVNTGYVKLTIKTTSYTYKGNDDYGNSYGTWIGNFTVESYADENDSVVSDTITVKVYDNYQAFLEQKIMKNINLNSDKEDSVFDVLSIDSLETFKEALKLYSLNRLKSFYDAIQSALDVLIETNQSMENSEFYTTLYYPYRQKLQACQEEIDLRQADIDLYQVKYDNALSQQKKLQKELNFENYLGSTLFKVFCSFMREDIYQNTNYISTGLTDSEIIGRAKEFISTAKKELLKASSFQYSISSTLYNLLVMPEFKPIINKFKLGNWLRICVDGEIYRLRLTSYTLSFSSIQSLNVEFSTATKLNEIGSDMQDILDSAQNMATTFPYVAGQASNGEKANDTLIDFVKDGLTSALNVIKNNNNEEITLDKHGLWAKTYNSETGNYDLEMLRVTHNILCFSDDGFVTVKTALGKHKYYKFDNDVLVQDTAYGLTSNFLTAGYIYSSQIISGEIYSENYKPKTQGTYFNLIDGDFQLANGKFLFDSSSNTLSLNNVLLDWNTTTNPEIGHIIGLTDEINGLSNKITINANSISAEITRATKEEELLSASIKLNTDNIALEVTRATKAEENLSASIKINADNIALKVSTNELINSINVSKEAIELKGNRIVIESDNLSVSKDGTLKVINGIFSGKITSTEGSIGGINIGTTGLYYSGTKSNDGFGLWKNGVHSNNDSYIIMHAGGNNSNIANSPFKLYQNGALHCGDIDVTGGKIGDLKVYQNSVGDTYLETIATTAHPLTAGIGNNGTWAIWAGWKQTGTDDTVGYANFWVTQGGDVHTRSWIYGADETTWAIWTKRDASNMYGLEYVYGEWDSSNEIMNVKFTFFNHHDNSRFTFNLPMSGYV